MRKLGDWLKGFIEYGNVGEAPEHVLFWSGVSAIAGALGRKCYFDQYTFKWFPNMYVVIVAPPGVIAKTTTSDLALKLLRKVDDVYFGPNCPTWQALVSSFEKAERVVEYAPGEAVPTYSLTIQSGELGNFLDPDDRKFMDMLNTMWDCGPIEKATKGDGEEKVEHPFLNIAACTTPSWLSDSIPPYMIGGGLVSRIVWVYAEDKARCVAYPGLEIPATIRKEKDTLKRYLIDDLGAISRLEGPFTLTPEAYEWGRDWYRRHCALHTRGKDDTRLGGFYARKQTHLHKLAMVLSASRSDSRIITLEDIQYADREISALETTMLDIFEGIGKTETANVADRLADFIRRAGPVGVSINTAFSYIRGSLPKPKDFDEVWKGLKRSGIIKVETTGPQQIFIALPADKAGSSTPSQTKANPKET